MRERLKDKVERLKVEVEVEVEGKDKVERVKVLYFPIQSSL